MIALAADKWGRRAAQCRRGLTESSLHSHLLAMIFDAFIYALTALAFVFGFKSGLLRSLATVLGYIIAAPVGVGVAPALSVFLAQRFDMPPSYDGRVMALSIVAAGMVFSALLRRAVNDVTGPQVSLPDRIAGALVGVVRIGFLGVLFVVIFDRIIPQGHQPAFLAQSSLYPYLSAAGQAGMKALPPEVMDYIDRLKKERGL
jgi:membrane protein required for colicin V production